MGDADSTGAIVGQIAGAIYGYESIPDNVLQALARWDNNSVTLRAVLLFKLGRQSDADKAAVRATNLRKAEQEALDRLTKEAESSTDSVCARIDLACQIALSLSILCPALLCPTSLCLLTSFHSFFVSVYLFYFVHSYIDVSQDWSIVIENDDESIVSRPP